MRRSQPGTGLGGGRGAEGTASRRALLWAQVGVEHRKVMSLIVSGERKMRDEEKSLNMPSRGEKQKHLCNTVLFM